jgi:putative transposase
MLICWNWLGISSSTRCARKWSRTRVATRGSSYRPTLGLDPTPSGLTIGWVLDQFAKTKPAARKRYAAFVHAGIGNASPWGELKAQVLLGGDAFVGQMTPRLEESSAVAEMPKRQRRLHRPALKTLLAGVDSKAARNEALARAYLQHGYPHVRRRTSR